MNDPTEHVATEIIGTHDEALTRRLHNSRAVHLEWVIWRDQVRKYGGADNDQDEEKRYDPQRLFAREPKGALSGTRPINVLIHPLRGLGNRYGW
jgi:hypothetical protein